MTFLVHPLDRYFVELDRRAAHRASRIGGHLVEHLVTTLERFLAVEEGDPDGLTTVAVDENHHSFGVLETGRWAPAFDVLPDSFDHLVDLGRIADFEFRYTCVHIH